MVTCFNRADTIERALNSIARQTFQDFEIIVVDDGSTDNSVMIIKDFVKSNLELNIRIYEHAINRGQNASINTAISNSNSELVAFLDSDDEWKPNFLKEMKKPFEDSNIGFAYCRLVGGPEWHLEGDLIFPEVLSQGFLSALGTLVVKSEAVYCISPLPERIFVNDMCQDDYICFELSKFFSCAHVPLNLYRIIGSSTSITRNVKDLALGWYQFYKHYENDIIKFTNKSVAEKYLFKCLNLALRSLSWKLLTRIMQDIICTLGYSKAIVGLARLILSEIRRNGGKLRAQIFSHNSNL